MSKIQKTTYTFVVLHAEDNPPQDIEHALNESYDGMMVGLETGAETVDVPDEKVVDELVALGNDGSFAELWGLGEDEG